MSYSSLCLVLFILNPCKKVLFLLYKGYLNVHNLMFKGDYRVCEKQTNNYTTF